MSASEQASQYHAWTAINRWTGRRGKLLLLRQNRPNMHELEAKSLQLNGCRLRARCDTAPPIWGNRSPLAAQSKVGYGKHTQCASMSQHAWRGTDGTRGVGTLDPFLMAPPPGPVGLPIPWAIHKGQPLYIHTYINGCRIYDQMKKKWKKQYESKSELVRRAERRDQTAAASRYYIFPLLF